MTKFKQTFLEFYETVICYFFYIIKYLFLVPYILVVGSIRNIKDFVKYEFKDKVIDSYPNYGGFKSNVYWFKYVSRLALKSDNQEILNNIRQSYNYDYVEIIADVLFKMLKDFKETRYNDRVWFENTPDSDLCYHDKVLKRKNKVLNEIYEYITNGREKLKQELSDKTIYDILSSDLDSRLFISEKDKSDYLKQTNEFFKKLHHDYDTKYDSLYKEDYIESRLQIEDNKYLKKIIDIRDVLWS